VFSELGTLVFIDAAPLHSNPLTFKVLYYLVSEAEIFHFFGGWTGYLQPHSIPLL
jgi:hypothetical protein